MMSVPVTWKIRKLRQLPSFFDEHFHHKGKEKGLIVRGKFTA
jgi:hypothetical protein